MARGPDHDPDLLKASIEAAISELACDARVPPSVLTCIPVENPTGCGFTDGTEAEPYMHITRIYPVQGELQAVREILGVSATAGDAETEGRVDTGFGSYFHLGAPLVPTPLAPTDEVETDDWDPNVRYI